MLTDDLFFDSPYSFTDEAEISAQEKLQVLLDWQRFIRSGFKQLFFTEAIYRLLGHFGLSTYFGRERCWVYYFAGEIEHLRSLLHSIVQPHLHNPDWHTGPAADLKAAMHQELSAVAEPIGQVLDDLERQHTGLVQLWRDFALNAGLEDVTLPTQYAISENTRNLLAFAVQIALKTKQPLVGLQLQFPMPLLYPEVQL